MSDLKSNLELAFTKLTVKRPFIGAVAAPLEKVIIHNGDPLYDEIPTAAVDGVKFYFNEDFCKDFAFPKLYGLVRHEVGHVSNLHSFRRNGRDPRLWNMACDAVVNYDILADGDELPDGGMVFDWVDSTMSAEEVYLKLLQQEEEEENDEGDGDGDGEQGDDEGTGAGGKKGLGRDVRDAPSSASEAESAARISSAARMAKLAGEGGASLNRALGGALEPRVRWQDVLRSFMTGAIERSDFNWKRPNRRFVANDLYLPSLYNETMGRLVIGVDTSGSISQEILAQVAGELSSIVADCRPAKVDVVYCDYVISNVESFTPDEPIKLHPMGGGGTRFKPVFDWVANNQDDPPVAMIYFTDTYGNMGELVEPEYPVLWALTEKVSGFVPPFGSAVEVY
jgi:predicted metal-dependent peptidase